MDAGYSKIVLSGWRTWRLRRMKITPPVAAWPILATVMAGVFFLTGRVDRLGYLGFFNLEPSLFPDDLSARVTYAMTAWTQALALFIRATSRLWSGHIIIAILAPTLALIAIAVALALVRSLMKLARRHATCTRRPEWFAVAADRIAGWLLCSIRWLLPTEAAQRPVELAWRVILGVLTLYIVTLVLGLTFSLSMEPFRLTGADSATQDAAAEFQDRAVVNLPNGGTDQFYRLMECVGQRIARCTGSVMPL